MLTNLTVSRPPRSPTHVPTLAHSTFLFSLAVGFPPQESPELAPLEAQGSGQTLLASMARAIGARAGASQELLGHFVRAGGGDVGKAASLYLAMADEFVELRAMARYLIETAVYFWAGRL